MERVHTSKLSKKTTLKREPNVCEIIRFILGEEFIKGALVQIKGYEEIDSSWKVEGNWYKCFGDGRIGICKGDLVWKQVDKLAIEKDRIYKMSKRYDYKKEQPIVTIWRVY